MASYCILRPLCTLYLLYPSPSSQDRVWCTGMCRRRRSGWPIFALQYRRLTDLSSVSVNLRASSVRSNGLVLPHCNLRGNVNTVANAEVAAKVSDSQREETELYSDDENWDDPVDSRWNNTENIPDDPVDLTADPGPDFDYTLYATNTMEDFVTPPEPRIPFGGPFEDYYDEYIGLDYVPKQEKPTSSFLMFLDSLNQKRAEEEAKLREKDPSRPPFDPKPNKHLFDDKKPLFTLSRPTHPAPPPRTYTPPTPGVREEKPWLWREKEEEPFPYPTGNARRVTEPLSKPLISQSQPSPPQRKPAEVVAEKRSVTPQTRFVEEYSPNTLDTPSQSTKSPGEIGHTSRPLSPQSQSTSLEESRASERSLIPQLRATEESTGGRPLSPSTRPLEGTSYMDSSKLSSEAKGPVSMSSYPGSGSDPDGRSTEGSKSPSESTRPNSVPSYSGSNFTDGTKPPLEVTGPGSTPAYPERRFIEGSKPSSEATRPSSIPSYPGNRDTEGCKPPMEATSPSSVPSYQGSKPPLEATGPSNTPFYPGSKPPLETTGPNSVPSYPGSRFVEGSKPPSDYTVPSSIPSYPGNRFVEGSSSMPSYPGSSFNEGSPPMESTRPSQPPMESTRPSSVSSYHESRFLEGSQLPMEATRPSEGTPYMKPSFPQNSVTKPVEEARDMVNASSKPLFSQTSFSHAKPLEDTLDSNRVSFPQAAGSDGGEALPKSKYYEPKEGDIVLGVVIYSCDDELDLEIGAEFPGLMTMRDFQPLDQLGDKAFFKLASGDGSSETFVPPLLGKSFLVEDKAANDGIYRGNLVDIGTVVVAEVQSRALIDGRALLTCRRLARSLGFLRIEQLRRIGEPIQIEIAQCNDGGLQGYLEGVRAFLPRSELLQRPENMAMLQDYIGKTLTVAVVQAEEQASNVIISEVKPWMSENLLLGTVHDLTVTRIYPYGMQVEINNTRIRGFIHISNITRGYVTAINNFFVEGDKIRAMVIKGRKPGQISFSIEALEPQTDPGLVLRDKEQAFQDGDDMATTTEEYQLPLEERRIFGLPAGPTSIDIPENIANLSWLQLQDSKTTS